ncbi:MAG TPA: hypothetical protein VK659_08465 [Asanoa sp.]|nr:hypothetical protein [Asanoa sp.]
MSAPRCPRCTCPAVVEPDGSRVCLALVDCGWRAELRGGRLVERAAPARAGVS